MESDLVTIPLAVAAVIGAVYLGAIEILLGLAQAYSPGEQSSIFPQLSSAPILILVLTMVVLLVIVAAVTFLSKSRSTRGGESQ